jgi:hypothetical protein
MTTKIRIDLSQGIIEAEGNEDFVRMVYRDFKEQIQAAKEEVEKRTRPLVRKKKRKEEKPKKKKVARKIKSTAKLVRDLNLAGGDGKASLRDFFKRYSPGTDMERNLIFIYYLQEILGLTEIAPDHVFTCYRDRRIKVPKNLEGSLLNTSHKKGWIDTASYEDIKVTVSGMNYLEHDMPKASEPKKK